MNTLVTRGIVLSRTDYGEADRIVTMLTPDHGKLRLMARGVRKLKSKLAGGIELFSISDITFMAGKGDIGTLISARLLTNYGEIAKDIDRVQLGYELIKLLNKATEDHTEKEYFGLLQTTLDSLNDSAINLDLIQAWFQAQLLKLGGHAPNLSTDTNGRLLNAETKYGFDFEAMAFSPSHNGRLKAEHIKVLRLLFSGHQPAKLTQVQGLNKLLKECQSITSGSLNAHHF